MEETVLNTTSLYFTHNRTGNESNFWNVTPQNQPNSDSVGQSPAEIRRLIYVTIFPFLVIFGSVGNLLIFVVMRRGSMKHVSTGFYMAILALADTGVLLGGSLLEWISNYSRRTIDPFKWTDCKFTFFCWYFFHHFSSAMLVIMSIEKCFALYFPLKAKGICTVKTARWVTFITGLSLAAFDAQFFIIVEKNSKGERDRCNFIRVSPSYILTYNRIDSALYSLAPFVIMGITNLAIMYKFTKAKLLSARNGTGSTSQALSKSSMRGVAALVTVSIMFILLTGPEAVVYSITHYPHPVLHGVLRATATLNHSINSVLYCIVGTRFRQELINTLCCRRKKNLFYSNGSLSNESSRLSTKSRVQPPNEGAGSPI